jgi:hypothetical protein
VEKNICHRHRRLQTSIAVLGCCTVNILPSFQVQCNAHSRCSIMVLTTRKLRSLNNCARWLFKLEVNVDGFDEH